jgi:Protein of unknown function (DUF3617)
MSIRRNLLTAGLCLVALALIAWGQVPKAGLYEVTNKMTWQQSPFPEGMQAPQGSGAPHTALTCVTQAQIDKYSGPKPQANRGCQITNIQKHDSGMTAEISCGAPMTGKGTVETSWTDSAHSKSKVHFTGSMQMGPNSKAVEWTIESESTYKGPDCGSVKPAAE